MVPQMVLSPESFPAYLARVWSLVRVGPLVNQQVVRLGEVASAEPADVLLLDPVVRKNPRFTGGDKTILISSRGGQMMKTMKNFKVLVCTM